MNRKEIINYFKLFTIYIFSLLYIFIGIKHFINPNPFLAIMPRIIPIYLHELFVYLSGFFEVLLGLLLLFDNSRKYAAYGIILLLIAVYPANIYLAFNDIPQKALNISSFLASWIRLPIQFILIGFAFWHSR